MRKTAALGAAFALASAMLTSAVAMPSASAATCTPNTWLEQPTVTGPGSFDLNAHYNTCGQTMTLSFKSRVFHDGRYESFARYFDLNGKDVATIGMSGCGGDPVKGQYETTLKVGQTLIDTSAPKTFTSMEPACG